MKLCQKCESPLLSAVTYCPFCGTAGAGNGHQAAPAPAAPGRPTVAPDVPSRPAASKAPAAAAQAPVRPVPLADPVVIAVPRLAERAVPSDAPPTQAPKKGVAGKWIVGAVILVGVFFYLRGKPDQGELACNTAFDAGTKAIANKDLAAARLQASTANGMCVGPSRSKATSLQAAIDAAENTSSACLRSFRVIEGHLDDHKLSSARSALNALSSTCSADTNAATWRSKLSDAVATAQGAQATLRKALDDKDLAQARAGLQQLVNANRENPDLPAFKGEVNQLASDVAAAATAAAQAVAVPPAEGSAPMPVHPAAPTAPSLAREPARAAVRRSEPDSAVNQKADMAAAFLRDAETALAQKKFDAARTYVDSARRMDPSNPRLDSLTQQIRDRERQVLQQETIIR